MRSIVKIIIAIATTLAFAGAHARTIGWAIAPEYDALSRLRSDFYQSELDGKHGLVKVGDGEILPAEYEIQNFINGYALAVTRMGDKLQIRCIVGEAGDVVALTEKYYISRGAPYFSEGKLVVVDGNGKYGYINAQGQLVVKCQFDNALPFKQGWAPIKQGNYYRYIKEGYDTDPSACTLRVDFSDGYITHAGCFADGLAPVAYNNKYALIDLAGKRVKGLSGDQYEKMRKANNAPPKHADDFQEATLCQVISEAGVYGLAQGADTVAIPQFASIGKQYADGCVIATKDGKTGLLSVIDGSYAIAFQSATGSDSALDVSRDGNIEEVALTFSAPEGAGELTLMVDSGAGRMAQTEPNGSAMLIAPTVADGAEECRVSARLLSDGLIVAEASKQFGLIYPIILDVARPAAVSAVANENDYVTIYSVVTNSSRKPVTVTVTLTAKGTVSGTYDIQPGGSARISIDEKVTEARTVNATVTLSTGESASSTLLLEPYN